MPPHFLARPLELLTADGAVLPLGAGGATWRRPAVLIARELCSFAWFEPAGVAGAQAASAARLYARTGAPFANAGSLVRRGKAGFGVWWWDLDRVGAALAARPGGPRALMFPETLAQPSGQGWRIVRLRSGYEAQCWRDGALTGSAWRLQRFDATAWAAFIRFHRQADGPAPEAPPAPESLPVLADAGGGLGGWREMTPGEALQAGAGVAAVALLASSALFLGQGWRLQALARTAEAQSAAVRAAAPRPGPADQLAARRLAAFRQLSARPNGLAALSVALGVLKLYGAEPTGLAVDSSSLTLTLPYSAIDKVDRIALELEDSGAFSDVRPITDARGKTIALQMKLGRAGAQAPAPVSPGG